MAFEDGLTTEARNPLSETIDRLDARGIVALMNAEDHKTVQAVAERIDELARVVELVADRFRRGGRLFYVGAGTSGRLGVLDASECPPTFSTPPEWVVGIIAGGREALTRAIEGAEDDAQRGGDDLEAHGVGPLDVVVGIATSGRTPYVLGAVARAKALGATTVGIACNQPSLLGQAVDHEIALIVGPEVIAGSTRLKAGTATKMALNIITTGSLVLIGKTYGNRMVDLTTSNEKLRIRARRIIRELTGVDDDRARVLLEEAGGHLKTALVMELLGVGAYEARAALNQHQGRIADILSKRAPSTETPPLGEPRS